MKQSIADIELLMNKDNMQFLMKGYTIRNFDEIKDLIFAESDKPFVYKARKYDKNTVLNAYSEYPNNSDEIVGRAMEYFESDGKRFLKVDITDSLSYAMLDNACIKLNGYCTVGCDEDGDYIIINKITRITLADRSNKYSDLYLPE